MGLDFYFCIAVLIIAYLAGLAAAWYNLNDEEGRTARLNARRAQRRNRKNKWMWPR